MIAKHITIQGSRVAYWIFNDHQPDTIVMIHGFRGTHHGLMDIIAFLPQFRIIVPDLPGFGESTPMTTYQHDIAGYSAFIKEFLQKLHLSRPSLLGHSFGSIVAAHFAAHHSSLIAKLILVNPIASPALKGPRQLFTQIARLYYWLGKKLPERSGRALLASPIITYSTSVILSKTKDKQLRRAIHRKHLQHFSTFQTRQALNQAFAASITATALDNAEAIGVPTLLIAGDLDDIAPVTAQYELERRIPQASLVILADVGHLIHHEKPQQASQAIQTFLSS